MSERIGRLCDELRIKLHGMDRRLEALKSNGVATFDNSQDVLESRLDRVEQRIYDNRVTVEAANGSRRKKPALLWVVLFGPNATKLISWRFVPMMPKSTPLPSSSLRLQRPMKPHSQSCRHLWRETMLMLRFCARRSLTNVYY
jgi:hypothetical protein